MRYEWIAYEGYDDEYQYVDQTGKICAIVNGSRWRKKEDGWTVRDIREIPGKHVGRYISLATAKSAAELLCSEE